MTNTKIIILLATLVLTFGFGTGQPVGSNSEVQNRSLIGSEGNSISFLQNEEGDAIRSREKRQSGPPDGDDYDVDGDPDDDFLETLWLEH